jgi:NADPH-dependent ferric siderophore reductase
MMAVAKLERRTQRIRHELRLRNVRVSGVERLSEHFVSVVFYGPELEGFRSDGFDDHVKFMLPGPDGEWIKRDYTPRRFDAERNELTIEFLLHGEGPASDWARSVQPGDGAAIGGPKSSMVVPTDYDWHLLAGDATALPAIHRRLEELPAEARAIVIAQVEPADRRELCSAAPMDLTWLAPDEDIAPRLRRLALPDGDGFAWCAGEASDMALARDILFNEKGHPVAASRVAAYWDAGQAQG